MKASKILAGLSAVSLAASMLSMVAASADEEKLSADFTDDEAVTDTENVADADLPFGGPYNWSAAWGGYNWFNPFIPAVANGNFVGWPGWGVAEFPDYWELATGLKTVKDAVWETYGTNDIDKAAPGYLVYEFENGKKWLVPASVDKNGQYTTEEVYIPYTNVEKIYFLYEVSENPYFQLSLDKFVVNGKEVQLNKDNWKDEVKYVKTTSDGDTFLLDVTNNSLTVFKNAFEQYLLDGKNNYSMISDLQAVLDKEEFDYTLPASAAGVNGEAIGKFLKFIDGLSEDQLLWLTFVAMNDTSFKGYAEANGITIKDDNPALLTYEMGIDVDESTNGFVTNTPVYYQATIFDKGNTTDSVINHGLILWNTKVSATFTVSNIGTIPGIHGKYNKNYYNGKGDDKGDYHTHVDPDEAGGLGVQSKNLNEYPVNPKFAPGDKCSADLYDALVEVYNSDPEHKADAEITFKTVADKGGVLVANFINVWEKDEVRQADGSFKTNHWLKDFENGFAIYVKEDDVFVEASTTKYYDVTYYELKVDSNGDPMKEDLGDANNPDTYFVYEKRTKTVNADLKAKGFLLSTTCPSSEDGYKNYSYNGDIKVKTVRKDGKDIFVSKDEAKEFTLKASDFDYEEPTDPEKKTVWAYDCDRWIEKDKATLCTALQNEIAAGTRGYKVDDEGKTWLNVNGFALDVNKNPVIPVGTKYDDEAGKSKYLYAKGTKFLAESDVEEAYCWHPYFVTENGLVDVVTKNYMGENRTNVAVYNKMTDDEIKYLKDNNGMYYNDDIHHAAYGHFVVFGDNTEREYSYRINAEAVKAILDKVQRTVVEREYYIYRHGAEDIYNWQIDSDSVKFGPHNELIVTGDHPDGFTKDYESQHWLDSQIATDPDGESKDMPGVSHDAVHYPHARATHGAVWLQCCEGTYLRDVTVHTYTTLLKESEIPSTIYGPDKKEYTDLFPTKPAESAASSSTAASTAPSPTPGPDNTDSNADSGAAAGFGIAGLLLAGAAMVCAKKKEQ